MSNSEDPELEWPSATGNCTNLAGLVVQNIGVWWVGKNTKYLL